MNFNWNISYHKPDHPDNLFLDYKVEFGGDENRDCRRIYYRMVPSQLTWWQQWFCNPWHQFYHAQGNTLSQWFTIEQFWKDIKPITTVRDAIEYNNNQNAVVKGKRDMLVKKGWLWPEDLNE